MHIVAWLLIYRQIGQGAALIITYTIYGMINSFYYIQTATVCDLYGKVRAKWPELSEKYFRLINGTTQISPDNGCSQLDEWDVRLYDQANVDVTFAAFGGGIGQQNRS